jgi:hypothetical protein
MKTILNCDFFIGTCLPEQQLILLNFVKQHNEIIDDIIDTADCSGSLSSLPVTSLRNIFQYGMYIW